MGSKRRASNTNRDYIEDRKFLVSAFPIFYVNGRNS